MSNFKPGDKAIYVGPVKNPFCVGRIAYGDEVHLMKYVGDKRGFKDLWKVDVLDSLGSGMLIPEQSLRKPDDYDITAQEWYQRILRGERLEETA